MLRLVDRPGKGLDVMQGVPHLVALVRAGANFINGQLAERPSHRTAVEPPTGSAA